MATTRGTEKSQMALRQEETRIVRAYLRAIESRPAGQTRRSPERIERRLQVIAAATPEVDVLRRLQLTQEQMDLTRELAQLQADDGLDDVRARFTKVAAAYSDRKGISPAAWRQVGVPKDVLDEAGIR